MNCRVLAEANTQAEIYHQCRLMGLRVQLEMSTPVGRLDVAILSDDGESLMAIIECKRDGWKLNESSRQITRYKTIGVEVFCINDMNEAEGLVMEIHGRMKSGGLKAVGLEDVNTLRKITRRRTRFDCSMLEQSHTGRMHIKF